MHNIPPYYIGAERERAKETLPNYRCTFCDLEENDLYGSVEVVEAMDVELHAIQVFDLHVGPRYDEIRKLKCGMYRLCREAVHSPFRNL